MLHVWPSTAATSFSFPESLPAMRRAVLAPCRSEQNPNPDVACRVPASILRPGASPAGTTLDGIVAHEDWLPTFAVAAGGRRA